MSAGTQCDNCRVFGPQHAPGWFYLGQQPRDGESRPLSSLLCSAGRPSR